MAEIDNLYKSFQFLLKDNLCFLYQGNFHDKITDKIIDLSAYNISNYDSASKMSKRISFLMVECFQNIIRHGYDHQPDDIHKNKSGIFIIRHIGQVFFITSVNIITNEKIPALSEKLDRINQLDREELRILYRELLEDGPLSQKGGVGIGLVEMARKSGQKLGYSFQSIDKGLSYFYLQVMLKMQSDLDEGQNEKKIMNDAETLHKYMLQNNLLLIHKGDFAQDSVVPILRLIEDNMQGLFENFMLKKKTFHILVEILQNISKHSYESNGMHEGIFFLGIKNNEYVISAGNYIENEKVSDLKKKLDALNELDKYELVELYKKTLKEGKETIRGGAGLGMIDIAKESTSKLNFNFLPIDKDKSFFLLSVTTLGN